MWYASPGNQGWGAKSLSRKASVVEADVALNTTNTLKPSAGRVIRIINNIDHSVQVSIKAFVFSLILFFFIMKVYTTLPLIYKKKKFGTDHNMNYCFVVEYEGEGHCQNNFCNLMANRRSSS